MHDNNLFNDQSRKLCVATHDEYRGNGKGAKGKGKQGKGGKFAGAEAGRGARASRNVNGNASMDNNRNTNFDNSRGGGSRAGRNNGASGRDAARLQRPGDVRERSRDEHGLSRGRSESEVDRPSRSKPKRAAAQKSRSRQNSG